MSNIIFNCKFCNYQSRYDLKECPGCGRINRAWKPAVKHQSGSVQLQFQTPLNIELTTPWSLEPQAATLESSVYECEICRHQTSNFLHKCPECVREKFVKTVSSAEAAPVTNSQSRRKDKRSGWETVLDILVCTSFFQVSLIYIDDRFLPDLELSGAEGIAIALVISGIVVFLFHAFIKLIR